MDTDGKLTVALLSGGRSSEREISLSSGDHVFDALDKNRYRVLRYDPQSDLSRLVADAAVIDVALVILHGMYGEDGAIQGLLDLLEIPYQCSGVLGSCVAMNKAVAKQFYERAGIEVPPFRTLFTGEKPDTNEIVNALGLPLVIKPAGGGSSIGMAIVREKTELAKAIDNAFAHDSTVVIEAFLNGIEITGGVLGNDNLLALPLIEIIPKTGHEFFDFSAKYDSSETEEICPARLDKEIAKKAQNIALAAHKALFCSGYSRTDMIVRDNRIYVLETNTIPGMTPASLLPLAARTAGISYAGLIDRLIGLALEKKSRLSK
ncbi:MAG: D-alanine--D-alanine ligase [Deltaproteobacteria bacterium]|nr:D-alanine--D-alanine ligase [Deltaproteobacteria bacterium]